LNVVLLGFDSHRILMNVTFKETRNAHRRWIVITNPIWK